MLLGAFVMRTPAFAFSTAVTVIGTSAGALKLSVAAPLTRMVKLPAVVAALAAFSMLPVSVMPAGTPSSV